MEDLRTWAGQGDAKAAAKVGLAYYDGSAGVTDRVEAVKWFQKAAELGEPGSKLMLAVMYEKGDGVVRDFKESARWYGELAEAGDPEAQLSLARLLLTGEGMAVDPVAAYKWLDLSAGSGNERAVKARNLLARKLTPEQLVEAEKQVVEYLERQKKQVPH